MARTRVIIYEQPDGQALAVAVDGERRPVQAGDQIMTLARLYSGLGCMVERRLVLGQIMFISSEEETA